MLLHGRIGREVTYVQEIGGGGAGQVEVLGLPGGQVGQRQGRPRVRGMLQKHARKRERETQNINIRSVHTQGRGQPLQRTAALKRTLTGFLGLGETGRRLMSFFSGNLSLYGHTSP